MQGNARLFHVRVGKSANPRGTNYPGSSVAVRKFFYYTHIMNMLGIRAIRVISTADSPPRMVPADHRKT